MKTKRYEKQGENTRRHGNVSFKSEAYKLCTSFVRFALIITATYNYLMLKDQTFIFSGRTS